MNFVFILEKYLPIPSSNTVCMLNIMNELKKNNHNVRFVAINECESVQNDENCKYVSNKKMKKFTFLEKIKAFFKFSSYSKELVSDYYNTVMEMHSATPIDYLVCVHNIYESVKVGQLIKKHNKTIKCLVYYLDAPGEMISKSDFIGKVVVRTLKTEIKKFVKSFDLVFIPEYWNKSYCKQMKFIGKNVKAIGLPNLSENIIQSKLSRNKIKIVYTGQFYDTIRGVEFIKVFSKLLDINTDIELHFYSKGQEDKLQAFAKSYPNNVILHGYVGRNEIQIALKEANMFLNVSNRLATFVPGKLFEYLSYAKPIINYQYIDNDPTIAYINKYDLCYNIIDGQAVDIDNLNNFIEENKFAIIDYENVRSSFASCLPTYSINLIVGEI